MPLRFRRATDLSIRVRVCRSIAVTDRRPGFVRASAGFFMQRE